MRNRIERLRLWLVLGAGGLVLVLAAFIGSARYMSRHFLATLPKKLGVDIKSETNGFTYSQSVQGKTVYTVHAAKEIEHTDGKITLHDVQMVLYGRKQDRADAISGEEFEYDQNAGVLRALGLVHIDMQASTQAGQASGGAGKAGVDPDKILHATTSGLVYMQNLGVAATGERIEFQLGEITGHAVGADYNTDTGTLMLHSNVSMSGLAGGRPVTLDAASAELDNRTQQALLHHARYGSMGQTLQAEDAVVHTRADGTVSGIEARGQVTAESDSGTVVSERADVRMNAQGQPASAVMTGSVLYARNEPMREVRGTADAATVEFDGQAHPQPRHAVFAGAVHMIERTRASEDGREPWSLRDLTAAKVEIALAPVAAGKVEMRDAVATGGARLTLVDNGSLRKSGSGGTTGVEADALTAHLVSGGAGRGPQLDTVAGRGHTAVRQLAADGLEQTSTGDTLDARFRPGAKATGKDVSKALASAVQQGHVSVVRRLPAKPAAKGPAQEDVQHATADRAAYDGDTGRVALTGAVELSDAGSMLWANQATLDHATGDAAAQGSVKVNYVQDASAQAGKRKSADEPAHILADRAEMKHATQVATFFGAPVRVWQGGSQVQAPVVEFAKAQQRMTASGDQPGQVHTLLVSVGKDAASEARPDTKVGAAKGGPLKSSDGPRAVRIASSGLTYIEASRLADFTGGVTVQSADGTMRSREALVYLQPSGVQEGTQVAATSGTLGTATGAGIGLDGRVERIVATGDVAVDQPGRRAAGERLVYTASDRVFVLTAGSGGVAKVIDTRGTTMGAAFRFHSGDESVEALNAAPGEAASQRVRTEGDVADRKGLGTKR